MANNGILRTDVSTFLDPSTYPEIIQGAIQQSTVLNNARRLPNMTTTQEKMNLLDTLPTAGFLKAETDHKPLTTVSWGNKTMYAEELACIVPISENVLADASIDIFGQVRPLIQQEFGRAIDAAILFGTGKPTNWRADIVSSAKTASKVVTQASSSPDIYKDIMGTNGLIAKVESSGTLPNLALGAVPMRAQLRELVDADKRPLFKTDMQGSTRYALDGIPMIFPMNGAFDATKALIIMGDFSKLVYSIRQDLTFKILTEATIVDPSTKTVIYNLAQQDMVALRCVMRLGWEILDPISAYTQDENQKFPFAVYAPAGE